jgi:hypothetical protein
MANHTKENGGSFRNMWGRLAACAAVGYRRRPIDNRPHLTKLPKKADPFPSVAHFPRAQLRYNNGLRLPAPGYSYVP